MVPATFSLMQRLPKSGKDRVAVVAVVLAHIREDDSRTRIARSIGRKTLSDADSALLSENRFRRLLQTDGNDERLTRMVRLVRHMKGKANVADMARTILYWGDKQRQQWAFEYYAVGAAAPPATGPVGDQTDNNLDTDIEEASA
jgi:CRISPR system Cascade subunit CasB